MVVFGGDRGGKYLNDVWSYSLADNSWTQLQARRPPCSFGYMSSKSPPYARSGCVSSSSCLSSTNYPKLICSSALRLIGGMNL